MKHTEIIAVIDVGSNTIRLLIGKLEDGKIERIFTDRAITRLGWNLNKTNKLYSKSLLKSIIKIKEFKVISEKYNAIQIIAVGTSALREALDGKLFCDKAEELAGINIKIISGEEEAFYTLEGIKLMLPYSTDSLFAVDIGGGSTEWIYSEKGKINKGSIDIGVLKSYKEFFKSDPPTDLEINQFQKFLKDKIMKNIPCIKIDKIIATGGTAVTLAMLDLSIDAYLPEKINMREIHIAKLKDLVKEISKMTLKERKKIKALLDRADIILPGLIILESISDRVEAKKIMVSDYGLMEGIMKNYKNFCYN